MFLIVMFLGNAKIVCYVDPGYITLSAVDDRLHSMGILCNGGHDLRNSADMKYTSYLLTKQITN